MAHLVRTWGNSVFSIVHEGTTCSIGLDLTRKNISLSCLYTAKEYRGKGGAKAVISLAKRVADRLGWTLWLWVGPYADKPMSYNELQSFYHRMGFRATTGDNMSYVPKRRK